VAIAIPADEVELDPPAEPADMVLAAAVPVPEDMEVAIDSEDRDAVSDSAVSVVLAPAVIVASMKTPASSVPLSVAVSLVLLAGMDVNQSVSVAVAITSVSYAPTVAAQTASVVPVILQSISPRRL